MPTTAKFTTRGGTSANAPGLVMASAIDFPTELSRRFFARAQSRVSMVTPPDIGSACWPKQAP